MIIQIIKAVFSIIMMVCLFINMATASDIIGDPVILVNPGTPSIEDDISISVRYSLPTKCYVLSSDVAVDGNQLFLDITEIEEPLGCIGLSTVSFSVNEMLAPLPAGDYEVIIRINSETQEVIKTFTVTSAITPQFSLLDPANGEIFCTLGIFEWEAAPWVVASYEVIIATDPLFENIIKTSGPLNTTKTIIQSIPGSGPGVALYWTVKTTDSNENIMTSDTIYDFVHNPFPDCEISLGQNGTEGYIRGLVKSDQSLAAVAGASVNVRVGQSNNTFTDINIDTGDTGEFIILVGRWFQEVTPIITISGDGFISNTSEIGLSTRSVTEAGEIVLIIDTDNDGIADSDDNCPNVSNIAQTNTDGGSSGDACDSDDDNDGIVDVDDNCRLIPNADQINTDGGSSGDACDSDDDNDGMPDVFEIKFDLDRVNPEDAAIDSDSDGKTNLEEFQDGSNPVVNESNVILIILNASEA